MDPSKRKQLNELLRAYDLKKRRDPWQFYVPYESRLHPGRRPQEEFHASPARIRAIVAGNRSGKTSAGAMECIWRAMGEHPYSEKWNVQYNPGCVPNVGWIIVPDWTNHAELVTLPKMREYLPYYRFSWDGKTRTWTDRKTKSQITVKTAESGREKFQGARIDYAWEDEEIPNDVHREVRVRLIDAQGDLWITATPLLGLTWLMDEIYEPWKNGIVPPSEIEVFNIHMRENPYLSEDEIDWMEREYAADVLAPARFEGKFVQLSGLVYPTFDPRVLHRWEGAINPNWKVFCSIDFGYTNPFVCLWHAVDGDGDVYTFDEHFQSERVMSEHIKTIKHRNAQWGVRPSYYVADPEAAENRAEMARWGIGTIPADKKFMDGMNRVREYMKPRPNGRPMYHVHPRCEKLIWQMGRYVFKKRSNQSADLDPYELADRKHADGPDALRYAMMSRPSPASLSKPKEPAYSMSWWSRLKEKERKSGISPKV